MNVCVSINNLSYLLVKYRGHLSAIFFFLLLYNNRRLSNNIDYYLIASFTLWHFALFLFDRVYDRKIDALSQPDEYVKDKHAVFLYSVVSILVLSSFVAYYLSGHPHIYWLILLPITFLYPLEVYKGRRIKNLFFIKNLYSAGLIYCLPLLIQAYLVAGETFDLRLLQKQPLVSLFISVMIGEVFWDIRDASVDKKFEIKTIPNILGIRFTKFYILALILIDSFITNSFFSTSAYIYLILIIFVQEDSNRLIFHLPPLIALIRFIL